MVVLMLGVLLSTDVTLKEPQKRQGEPEASKDILVESHRVTFLFSVSLYYQCQVSSPTAEILHAAVVSG